jgi:hypothetical protein
MLVACTAGSAASGEDVLVGHHRIGIDSGPRRRITLPDHARGCLTGAAWHMDWKGLGFSAHTSQGSARQLLTSIWGHVASQQVLGIMGPSGAGDDMQLLDKLC